MLNPLDFGAAGDGETDDTQALQKTLDRAAQIGGAINIPTGTYLCSELKIASGVVISGQPGWSYRNPGGSILKLAHAEARCLLDITGALGVTINGLSLEGEQLGSNIHGILMDKDDYGDQEDAPTIERCRISHFTGDGIHLGRVWVFSVRHCMLSHNTGCGLRVRGWDGFVMDNWLSGNKDAGYGAYDENASVTMTGNRIEWNGAGGIVLRGGSHYNITGNYIDRSFKVGIDLQSRDGTPCRQITATGNLIYRSGRTAQEGSHSSAHVRMTGAEGVTFTGNTLTVGQDDGGKGRWSPEFGIVIEELSNCVIANNTLHRAALKELILDRGEHGSGLVVTDNPGSTFSPS